MISAFLFACGLLLVGSVLRINVRILQRLFVPAAIVGGLIGLALVQSASRVPEEVTNPAWIGHVVVPLRISIGNMADQLQTWPGQLIAVVFAGLFLERKSRSFRQSMRLAGREGLVVWIIVLGQTTVGLIATWLLIQPMFDVPNSFGMLIETGFAGGHGTAAAMGEVFSDINMQDGQDLGMFMATVGLVVSVMSGLAYLNLAVRRGWTGAGDVEVIPVRGLEDRQNPSPIAYGTLRSEVLDPLLFQILILAAAVAVGVWLERAVVTGASLADTTASGKVSDNIARIPLFIYTLFGGLIVRKIMELCSVDDLIDSSSIQRLVGVAMEFLIVAAITTLNLTAVVHFAVPLSILIFVALAWTGFCLLYVSHWFLPKGYWFELGLINYGMSTGTTATGFVLLRVIDKDLASGAAEDYALAAPLSAPFVGGGVLTLVLPGLVLERFHIAIPIVVLVCVMAGLFLLAKRLAHHND